VQASDTNKEYPDILSFLRKWLCGSQQFWSEALARIEEVCNKQSTVEKNHLKIFCMWAANLEAIEQLLYSRREN
jgi:hypothetical protein